MARRRRGIYRSALEGGDWEVDGDVEVGVSKILWPSRNYEELLNSLCYSISEKAFGPPSPKAGALDPKGPNETIVVYLPHI
jgi:hypothetical protein